MNRRFGLSLFVCAFDSTAAAQELPRQAGIGRAFFGAAGRISNTVQKDIDDKRIAGAVTLVLRHGQRISRRKACRIAKRAKPMQPDAIFRICSMSKPITTAAVMILYEEGHFLLEDPYSPNICRNSRIPRYW